jgi:hypothetical protein
MHHTNKVFPQISRTLVIAAVAFLGFQFYRAVDAKNFNFSMKRKVESNQLIGKSEDKVTAVLGAPSHRSVYPNGDFTLNYFPGVLVPICKFQAHFRAEGTLRSIELMD